MPVSGQVPPMIEYEQAPNRHQCALNLWLSALGKLSALNTVPFYDFKFRDIFEISS